MLRKASDEGRQERILGWILGGVTSINDSTRVKTDSNLCSSFLLSPSVSPSFSPSYVIHSSYDKCHTFFLFVIDETKRRGLYTFQLDFVMSTI